MSWTVVAAGVTVSVSDCVCVFGGEGELSPFSAAADDSQMSHKEILRMHFFSDRRIRTRVNEPVDDRTDGGHERRK